MANIHEHPSFAGFNTGFSAPPAMNLHGPPRPAYFISRSNGLLVPLIPADELPFSVHLQGLPRVVALDQTYGMQHVGTAPYTGTTYTLETSIPHDPNRARSSSQFSSDNERHTTASFYKPTKQFTAPDTLARQALALQQQQSITSQPTSTRPSPSLPPRHPTRTPTPSSDQETHTQSLIDAIMSTTAGAATAASVGYTPKSATPVPPSGTVPDQDKKEFCTYWIRTGNCDYMQQGCLYKHEMPDGVMLRKIGFQNVPRWWVEKNSALKSGGVGVGMGMVSGAKPVSAWLKSGGGEKMGGGGVGGAVTSGSEADDSASEEQQGGGKESGGKMGMVPLTPTKVGGGSGVKKVFVPAGESAEKHIAAVTSKKSAKNNGNGNGKGVEGNGGGNAGLLASKHAPLATPPASPEVQVKTVGGKAKVNGGATKPNVDELGLRIRRPAAVKEVKKVINA